MKASVKELLPIGSVILLDGANKKLMIIGVKQTDLETDEEYDYLGVVYPEGSMGEDSSFFFDHDAIKKVYFTGYDDDERKLFIQKLDDFYNQE